MVAAMLTPLVTSGTPARAANGAKHRTLTVAVSQSVDSLSPFQAQTRVATQVHRLMYDFLTAYSPKDNHPVGGLANSWKHSKDKKTWTFHIRSGMKWSDGKPVTAKDAAFTYNKMMHDPDAATANGNFVQNFSKVTAESSHKLRIRLKKPQATMLALDIPVVPKHKWKSVKDYAKFNNDKKFPIVGDGPFVLTSYKPDQYIKLKANKHYWRGAPKFDNLVFKYYKDRDAGVEALRKGEVSFVSDLTPSQARSLENEGDITVNKAKAKRFFSLAFNPGARTRSGKHFGNANKALRKKSVRYAIDYAIDKKKLIKKVAGGLAESGEGYIPPRYKDWHYEPPAGKARGFDPKKAGKLLDKAGYRKGSDGMRTTPDGKKLSLRLVGHNDETQDKQSANYIREWLKNVGVQLDVSFVDSAGFSDKLSTGEWDIAFDGWTVNPDPDPVLQIHRCATLPKAPGGSAPTDMFFCDKKYEKLYNKQLVEYNTDKRQKLVKKLQAYWHDKAQMINLYYPGIIEAYRSDQVKSFTKQPADGGNINGQDGFWGWWSAVPAGSESDDSDGDGLAIGLGVGGGVLVVLVVGGVLLARRRSVSQQDRE